MDCEMAITWIENCKSSKFESDQAKSDQETYLSTGISKSKYISFLTGGNLFIHFSKCTI
jgi:hypothetical protein